MTQAVNVILYDLPHSISAYTVANGDLSYTIIINARLSHDMQLKAYKHELDHIERGDFNKKCSANIIEFFAHK